MSEAASTQQIRAARALLGWSLNELSAKVDISAEDVAKVEAQGEEFGASGSVSQAIRAALEAAGIEFTREGGAWIGVRLRTAPLDASATERRIDDLEAKAAAMDLSGPPSPRRAMNTMKRAVASNDAANLREKVKRKKREERPA